MFREMSEKNGEECKVELKRFIEKEYGSIKEKFVSGDGQKFQEYLEEMTIFKSFLNENSPATPNQPQIITNSLYKKLQTVSSSFINNFQNKIEIIKAEKQTIENKLRKDLQEQKSQTNEKRSKLQLRNTQLEADNVLLIEKEKFA